MEIESMNYSEDFGEEIISQYFGIKLNKDISTLDKHILDLLLCFGSLPERRLISKKHRRLTNDHRFENENILPRALGTEDLSDVAYQVKINRALRRMLKKGLIEVVKEEQTNGPRLAKTYAVTFAGLLLSFLFRLNDENTQMAIDESSFDRVQEFEKQNAQINPDILLARDKHLSEMIIRGSYHLEQELIARNNPHLKGFMFDLLREITDESDLEYVKDQIVDLFFHNTLSVESYLRHYDIGVRFGGEIKIVRGLPSGSIREIYWRDIPMSDLRVALKMDNELTNLDAFFNLEFMYYVVTDNIATPSQKNFDGFNQKFFLIVRKYPKLRHYIQELTALLRLLCVHRSNYLKRAQMSLAALEKI